jgi:ankyrin repeat protein
MNIHDAAKCGDVEKVKSLLMDNPACVYDRKRGWTPLHWAAFNGHKDTADLLLASKADVNAADGNAQTPLLFAAWKGHFTVAELLLAKGASVNAKSSNGVRPLHLAAACGFRNVVQLLIANGADVNAPDSVGWTALDKAAANGKNDVVELLRQHGASAQGQHRASAQGQRSASGPKKNSLLWPVVGMICMAGIIVIVLVSFDYWSSRGAIISFPLWALAVLVPLGFFFQLARGIRSELKRRAIQRQLLGDETGQRGSTNL